MRSVNENDKFALSEQRTAKSRRERIKEWLIYAGVVVIGVGTPIAVYELLGFEPAVLCAFAILIMQFIPAPR